MNTPRTPSTAFTRRALLQAGAASALGFPLLESVLSRQKVARAQTMFPRRLVVFFTPNGTNPDAWFPTPGATEDAFVLNPTLAALAPHRQQLIFTAGVDMTSLQVGPGEPHQRGMGAVLTGTHLQEGTFVGGDGTLAGWGDGVSLDQHVAAQVGGGTQFRSLELGTRVLGSEVRHRINYLGPANPLPPRTDPRAVFTDLFGNFMAMPSEQAARDARRRAVLEATHRNFVALRGRVSAEDRQKLDGHREMVRDLQSRLSSSRLVCTRPDQPPPMNPDDENNMDDVIRNQTDLLVMSLACDLTRVATLQNSSGANNIRFPFLQSYSDDHNLSHAGVSDPTSQTEWAHRKGWYAQQFAYLLQRMKDVREGDGTLLDHTVILWCSELAQGNTHSHANMPFLLAGSCHGYFRTGRFVQYTGKSHNDLLVSLMNAMGVPGNSFGDPAYCTGPLPGLTA